MGVGGVKILYDSDEDLPSSDNSPPKEDGDEPGGEGGIPDPPAPRVGVSVGLIVSSPRGFKSRPVPSSCSLISKKYNG